MLVNSNLLLMQEQGHTQTTYLSILLCQDYTHLQLVQPSIDKKIKSDVSGFQLS